MKLEVKGCCPACKREITVRVSVTATQFGYDEFSISDFNCENCGEQVVGKFVPALELRADPRNPWERE